MDVMWMWRGGVRWIQWGRDVDMGGGDYKYVHNKPESEFLTGQAEHLRSCEHLGSCLAMDGSMMKSSMYLNADSSPPMSTLHPPDVIHDTVSFRKYASF